jgi:aminoglycoside N3'-acetyltransferase
MVEVIYTVHAANEAYAVWEWYTATMGVNVTSQFRKWQGYRRMLLAARAVDVWGRS